MSLKRGENQDLRSQYSQEHSQRIDCSVGR